MIDLSNNTVGQVDFARLYRTGQQRVYLKLTEATDFHDGRHDGFRHDARAAGLRVGEYHFARPSHHTAKDEADWFLSHLPRLVKGKDLRPCLDLEDPLVVPSSLTGAWAAEFVAKVEKESGHVCVIYGNAFYLAACKLPAQLAKRPLWLASYGRNDGQEHPYTVPAPWKHAAAHQYSSEARVAGVSGRCDVSRVFDRASLDVHVSR